MLKKMKSGFSLMEMMIVLLIISIIAAATAPMITKKMTRGAGTGDSPWVFTGDRNSIGYLSKNGQVLIGASKVPEDAKQSKLYIAGASNWSHIRFGNSNNSSSLGITANPGTSISNSAIGISNTNIPNGSIMFGMGQTVSSTSNKVVGIGNSVSVYGECSTAVGTSAEATMGDSTAIGNEAKATGEYSTAAGVRTIASAQCATAYGDTAHATETNATALGTWAEALGESATAVGYKARAVANETVAMGNEAYATTNKAISIGSYSSAENLGAVAIGANAAAKNIGIAIGLGAKAYEYGTLAIGNYAEAKGPLSSAIGNGAVATEYEEVTIGNTGNTVYIPGNLVVDGDVLLGGNKGSSVYMRATAGYLTVFSKTDKVNGHPNVVKNPQRDPVTVGTKTRYKDCDRRLKNVGEKYIAGLEELKKLDFYHYTYKKDEEKTPHVGVIAQDLQKVFPDAVIKGEDGYLRIRMEDMFYAVINAVKELDLKIITIVEKVDNLIKDFSEMKTLVENQQNEIKDLKAQNKEIIEVNQELIKRIEKLEKKSFKKD